MQVVTVEQAVSKVKEPTICHFCGKVASIFYATSLFTEKISCSDCKDEFHKEFPKKEESGPALWTSAKIKSCLDMAFEK